METAKFPRLKVWEGTAKIAFQMPGHYVWDSAVIFAEGRYHLFCSAWPYELGFGHNWLFNSRIIHATSDRPDGPYQFQDVVFERRGREYFDGMNTHNTCIRFWDGRYYLYYMGTTYSGNPPLVGETPAWERVLDVWNHKRIGVAVADSIDGPFERLDKPLLEPRDETHWDCTAITNPAVAILPSGETYMIYKSRKEAGGTLMLGVAKAPSPTGPFVRLSDEPILQFEDPDMHVEDPFLWYDEKRQLFCLLVKDDVKNGKYGLTGEWGSGFYAESVDCLHFDIPQNPKVYSRTVRWADGHTSVQGNMERASLLFENDGQTPTFLFNATGESDQPYHFDKPTYVVCQRIEEAEG